MDQYMFDVIWICFIMYDCPPKWWVWVPAPVTFALVDSTSSNYCSSTEKSAALHQEDGLVAFRVGAQAEDVEGIRDEALYYPSTQDTKHGDIELSVFEAARKSHRLTNDQHVAMVDLRDDFMTKYQNWYNDAHDTNVAKWGS